jgi:hypothetical protein
MGASNNAQGQNAGARQQIDQQTTQAMQRLMQYLGQNQAQPPPGGVTPGRPQMSGAPMMGGGQVATPGGAPQAQGQPPGGQQTMNPQQVQQLMQAMAMRGPQQ